MRRISTLVFAALLATAAEPARAQTGKTAQTVIPDEQTGVPSWLWGDLGPVDGDPGRAALAAVARVGDLYRLSADDAFAIRLVEADDLGMTHVRLQQQHRQRRVVGAELIVHMGREQVTGINGRFEPDLRLPQEPRLAAEEALAIAERTIAPRGTTPLSEPELVVFVDDDRRGHLSWTREVEYVGENGYDQVAVFADAETGTLLGRHPLILTAKDRRVHDGTGICIPPDTALLPGPLLLQEGGSLAGLGAAEVDAYVGVGKTYDYYRVALGRDSYDGAGSPLISSMHVTFGFGSSCSPNNAAWLSTKKQMVYGDGDGTQFTYFSKDVDVTAHELTHGVTAATANLGGTNEPGALNEAFSDIFGEVVDTFQQGCPAWKIGEDVYTPATPGDALRYMYDPALDGYSADYYPDRIYPDPCMVTTLNDSCGVHGNNGIANLAFKLLSTGGSHPHGKTALVVPAVGIDLSARIFHRALRYYLTPTSRFGDAPEATIQAARDIAACSPIKNALATAVDTAWHAVGVPHYFHVSPVVTVICAPSNPWVNVMYNGGFEASGLNSYGWTAVLGGGVITNDPTVPPYSGSWKAALGGNGHQATEWLYQQVSIPAVATSARLTFRLRVTTDEVTNVLTNDDLTVQLRSCGGLLLATLAAYSNLDAGSTYTAEDLDVTAFKGQAVRVYLKSVENGSLQTTFNLDSFALKVK